jgi:hypothetical protein
VSRSGYVEDGDYALANLWPSIVDRTIKGKRGQSFLRELAKVLDEMPEKKLIADELITETGEVCAIGAVCKARGLDTSKVDIYDRYEVGKLVGIAPTLAAEIEYQNDDDFSCRRSVTPEERWVRMRKWVEDNLTDPQRKSGANETNR